MRTLLTMTFGGTLVAVRSFFKRQLRVYMSVDEKAALESAQRWLGNLLGKPLSVLEWGSGGSTLYFSRLLPSGSRWFTLEHHPIWAERVRRKIVREHLDHVTLVHVPTNHVHEKGSGDGTEATFHDYVHYPETMAMAFDLIIVDGRARVPCANVGWKLLEPDGLLVLHDAQRAYYHPLLASSGLCRVRMRDPRKERDGGAIEMHFYLRDFTRGEDLANRLRAALNAKVTVTVEST